MPAFPRSLSAAGLVALLTLAAVSRTPAQSKGHRVTGDSMLVSSAWLAERLRDPTLVILHAGGKPTDYAPKHIPGAHHVPWEAFAVERDGRHTELPLLAQLDSALETVGVSDGSRIVIYGPYTAAARLYLTLDYLGLGARTSVLNASLATWEKEGLPVTSEIPKATRGRLTPKPRQDVVVDAEWVKARIGQRDVAIVDSRTSEFYAGTNEPNHMSKRPGHIPSAINIPFSSTLTDGFAQVKDAATLREIFRAAGADPGRQVVTYCHIGMQASVVYFIARYLGYDARMYDGSYQEWSNRDDLPVTTATQGVKR